MHRERLMPGVAQQPQQPGGARILGVESSGVGSGGALHHGRVWERGEDDHAHVSVTFGDLGNGR
jgi:hypothetical protein